MRSGICAALMATLVAISLPSHLRAQDATQSDIVQSPIMVLDFERVFLETAYGQRLAAELSAEGERVQQELDRLANELLAEESALTEARADMEPEAFRAAAEAFNERAQTMRARGVEEQNRLVALEQFERARFNERIQPLINDMMVARGAVVAMDRRSVLLALGGANATEEVIAAINRTLGDGRQDPSERPTLRPDTSDPE